MMIEYKQFSLHKSFQSSSQICYILLNTENIVLNIFIFPALHFLFDVVHIGLNILVDFTPICLIFHKMTTEREGGGVDAFNEF